jgi:hypothetical protein
MLPLRHKFNAKRTSVDNISFSSKKESLWYQKIKHRQDVGEVLFFLTQVPFRLPGNTKYLLDFMVFCADGTVQLIEVKGMKTPMGNLKVKQVEDLYGVMIEVV